MSTTRAAVRGLMFGFSLVRVDRLYERARAGRESEGDVKPMRGLPRVFKIARRRETSRGKGDKYQRVLPEHPIPHQQFSSFTRYFKRQSLKLYLTDSFSDRRIP